MFNLETAKGNKDDDDVQCYKYEDNVISDTYNLSYYLSYYYSNSNACNYHNFVYFFFIGTNKKDKINNQSNVKGVCVCVCVFPFKGFITNVFLGIGI